MLEEDSDAVDHQVDQAVLNDQNVAGSQPLHLVGIPVHAHHLVAHVGEARSGRQTNVSSSDDREL